MDIQEQLKRIDEKFPSIFKECDCGWGCDNCGACYNDCVDKDNALKFARTSAIGLLGEVLRQAIEDLKKEKADWAPYEGNTSEMFNSGIDTAIYYLTALNKQEALKAS